MTVSTKSSATEADEASTEETMAVAEADAATDSEADEATTEVTSVVVDGVELLVEAAVVLKNPNPIPRFESWN